REGGDRGEIGGGERMEDEFAGRQARLQERGDGGEREVEEEQEVAPAGGVELLGPRPRGGVRGGRDERQVDHLEARDLLLLAAVQDLEVLPGQTADGRAVAADDVDRHLDRDHSRDVLETVLDRFLSLGLSARRGLGERKRDDEGGDRAKAGESAHRCFSYSEGTAPKRRRHPELLGAAPR